MADPTLPNYERRDYTASASADIRGIRGYRPRGCCIHTTSGTSSLEWLTGGSAEAGRAAGADALIERSGRQDVITDDKHYAYHAGLSRLVLEKEYIGNEVSQLLLGVELECLDIQSPTFEQYDSLADLIVWYAGLWAFRWPFLLYGHYAVARPLGRRSDPVNFDWGELMGRLYVRAKLAGIAGL